MLSINDTPGAREVFGRRITFDEVPVTYTLASHGGGKRVMALMVRGDG